MRVPSWTRLTLGPSLIKNVRQVTFAAIPILFVGFNSAHAFIGNRPDAFANWGAIAIIWAVFNIAVSREHYASSITEWDLAFIRAIFDYEKKKDGFRDERIETTFNLHASQIAQIAHSLGRDNAFTGNDPQEIRDLCEDVGRALSQNDNFLKRYEQARKDINEIQAEYVKKSTELRDWSNLLWRVEAFLIIWGTLQNTFGADAVAWFHRQTVVF